jgi:predicted ATPase
VENEPFLRRFAVQNYKSIARCDVALRPLTVIVGRNGAGKSNFLDAMHFIADALLTSLDFAVRSRGGMESLRPSGIERESRLAFRFELTVSQGSATYELVLESRNAHFSVEFESLRVTSADEVPLASFHRSKKDVETILSGKQVASQPVAPNRLYLGGGGWYSPFLSAYYGLLSMAFYNLSPNAMKELQSPDSDVLLRRDGSNIASVIAYLEEKKPHALRRLMDYLATIVPEIESVQQVRLGPKETLYFRHRSQTSPLYAASMSDGTLRVLGALAAVAQDVDGAPARLVAIEEPEAALHPAATAALMDALREATGDTQVIVTSHSPDLLDQVDPETDALLIAEWRDGGTVIAGIDQASREAIRKHLYSAGELLRMDQLQPAPT